MQAPRRYFGFLQPTAPRHPATPQAVGTVPVSPLPTPSPLKRHDTRQSAADLLHRPRVVHPFVVSEGRIARARSSRRTYTEALHTVPRGTVLVEFDGGATRRLPRIGYGSYRAALDGVEICRGARIEFGGVGSSIESEALALATGLYQTWLYLNMIGVDPARTDVIVRGDCVDLVDALNSADARLMQRTGVAFVTAAHVFRSVHAEWHGRENSVALFSH